MTSNDWERVQRIFLAAVELEGKAQAELLDRECAGRPEIRNEIDSLLEADRKGFQTIAGEFQEEVERLVGASLVGERIGPYRIERELGRGGMGVVYIAARDDAEFTRKVAIKIVRQGLDSEQLLYRFRQERQVMAQLNHPYIARMFDGGETRDHRPFFVMEYIEGAPIDRYCREHDLSVAARCRLFLRVCEAVSYAHRSLVVHRDLKPGNILVTDDGTPKLLDFGIAKVLSSSAGEASTTMFASRPFTPDYASPEQIKGLPVTTSTDVYSLGAVLYEMLTGFKARTAVAVASPELERFVEEQAIPRPSSRNRQLAGDLDNILLLSMHSDPARRYSSVDQFAGDIERYLDGRPVKARQDSLSYRAGKYLRRYWVGAAVATLAVVSLLTGSVIALDQARKAEAARRVAEQERRRTEQQSRLAEMARASAESESRKARAAQQRSELRAAQLMDLANTTLLDVHAAIERLAGATEARRAIVRSTLRFLERLSAESAADDNLKFTLSLAYQRIGDIQGYPSAPSLGEPAAALESYSKAEALLNGLRASRGQDPAFLGRMIETRRRIGVVRTAMGQTALAEKVFRDVLQDAEALARRRPHDIPVRMTEATVHEGLVGVLRNTDLNRALRHARRALDIEAGLASAHPDNFDVRWKYSSSLSQFGSVHRAQYNLPVALEHFRKSVEIREQLVRERPNDVQYRRSLMIAYGQVASVLGDAFNPNLNEPEKARSYYERALAMAREIAAADGRNRMAQYDVASAALRLGALPASALQRDRSLHLLREASAILEDLSKSNPEATSYPESLAIAYEYAGLRLREAGELQGALQQYRRSLVLAEKALERLPDYYPSLGQQLADEEGIAEILAGEGKGEEALAIAKRAVARTEGRAGAIDRDRRMILVGRAQSILANVHRILGNWAEARQAAGRSLEVWREVVQSKPYLKSRLVGAEALVEQCDVALARAR